MNAETSLIHYITSFSDPILFCPSYPYIKSYHISFSFLFVSWSFHLPAYVCLFVCCCCLVSSLPNSLLKISVPPTVKANKWFCGLNKNKNKKISRNVLTTARKLGTRKEKVVSLERPHSMKAHCLRLNTSKSETKRGWQMKKGTNKASRHREAKRHGKCKRPKQNK